MNKLTCMLLLFPLLAPVTAWCALPMADVHVHYKWSQEEETTPEEALECRGSSLGCNKTRKMP